MEVVVLGPIGKNSPVDPQHRIGLWIVSPPIIAAHPALVTGDDVFEVGDPDLKNAPGFQNLKDVA
jgi:hypothetical protein